MASPIPQEHIVRDLNFFSKAGYSIVNQGIKGGAQFVPRIKVGAISRPNGVSQFSIIPFEGVLDRDTLVTFRYSSQNNDLFGIKVPTVSEPGAYCHRLELGHPIITNKLMIYDLFRNYETIAFLNGAQPTEWHTFSLSGNKREFVRE